MSLAGALIALPPAAAYVPTDATPISAPGASVSYGALPAPPPADPATPAPQPPAPPAANQYQNSNTPPADSFCYSCGDGGGGGG